MPKTELGGLLVGRGLLTKEQLAKALERQQSFGGRIGTCLLEIGALDEDDLLEALSHQLGVPAATDDELRAIPSELIELLPRSTALSCSAVPFRHVGERIDVALLDPGNFALEDELSFSMGRRIRPHIANELRIVEALHIHYGGDVPLRFRSLLDQSRAGKQGKTSRPKPALSPVPAYLRPGAAAAERPSRKPTYAPPKFDKQAIPLTPDERAALAHSRDSLQLVEQPTSSAFPSDEDERSHELYGLRLSQAETASQIGAALIQFLAREFPQVLLFRVTSGNEEVTGWLSHGSGLDLEWFRHYSVALYHATVFRDLARGAEPFVGRLEPTPAHRALARCWQGSLAHDCLLLPVSIRDKLVCVAWASRGALGLQGIDLDLLQKVAEKTALAFERCILRRKLQAT